MKFRLLLLFCSLLILSSCKSDDNSDTTDDTAEDFKAENRKALGLSAGDILSSGTYPKMVVEFVYSEGFRPRQETLDFFSDFLNERVFKPGGITFTETVIDPPPGAPYNSQEIRDIEDANRTLYTTDDTIAIYVFFSNGSAFGDTQTGFTLGSAYQNTSMVVYEKTLRDIALNNTDFDLGALEDTTLRHEFGHILGLVNIQQDDIHDTHEDLDNLKHDVLDTCLMFFQAQSANNRMIEQMMAVSRSKNQGPQLDERCIEDLQSKGGK